MDKVEARIDATFTDAELAALEVEAAYWSDPSRCSACTVGDPDGHTCEAFTCPECGAPDAEYGQHEPGCPYC